MPRWEALSFDRNLTSFVGGRYEHKFMFLDANLKVMGQAVPKSVELVDVPEQIPRENTRRIEDLQLDLERECPAIAEQLLRRQELQLYQFIKNVLDEQMSSEYNADLIVVVSQ